LIGIAEYSPPRKPKIGHWKCFVRAHHNHIWYQCDDATVKKAGKQIPNIQGKVFVYQKKSALDLTLNTISDAPASLGSFQATDTLNFTLETKESLPLPMEVDPSISSGILSPKSYLGSCLEMTCNVRNIKNIAEALYQLDKILPHPPKKPKGRPKLAVSLPQPAKKPRGAPKAAENPPQPATEAADNPPDVENIVENWHKSYWPLFADFIDTPNDPQLEFEKFVNKFQRGRNSNFMISLGKLFASPQEQPQLLPSIQAQIDTAFRSPTPAGDVNMTLERIIKLVNQSFHSFFPECDKLYFTFHKEWMAKCLKCSRRYNYEWPVCGDSRVIAKLGNSDAENGVIDVTKTLVMHLKDVSDREKEIRCGHCNKVTLLLQLIILE
jgi:hypothetical protein